jgi:hypothetical protein
MRRNESRRGFSSSTDALRSPRLCGAEVNVHKDKLAESNFASLAEMMSAYAEEAVRVAWNDHRQRLDFSEVSVDLLEQILDGQSAEDLDFQTRLWGGYFGEVMRKRFAGEWEFSQYPGGGVAVVPTLMIRGSRLYPLMKVYRRLTLGKGENLSAFYKMVAGRLDEPSPAH